MVLFPHFERETKSSTISHFLLMFGYKLFSLYFPLFLLSKGLSLPKIGFIYLLIYLPLALFSPIVGTLSHRISRLVLIITGIGGYALYSIGMLIVPSSIIFYLLQILLGVSAALFFTSNRILLVNAKLEKPSGSFGFFYSAPFYAQGAAPFIGALIIWKFGFAGVFTASFLIYLLNIFVTFFTFPKITKEPFVEHALKKSFENFILVMKNFPMRSIFPILLISFAMLIVGGFYQAFFITFLKHIGWTQNTILFYTSIFSILFLPISLYAIRILSKEKTSVIFNGGILFGVITVLLGIVGGAFGFIGVLILTELEELGSFITNSGRSGFLSKYFSSYAEEIGSLDNMFSPLGIAIGALLGSLFIQSLGYQTLFIIGGIFVLFVVFAMNFVRSDS